MADVHSKEVRSFNMSQIRSKNTTPELIVRKYLFANGYRYRLHSKKLPGKPDIVLPKYKTLILIHGCFWHGHQNCKYFVIPKTRTDWWLKKIQRNIEIDNVNLVSLKNEGWKIFTIFECDLKGDKKEKTLIKLLSSLKKLSVVNK